MPAALPPIISTSVFMDCMDITGIMAFIGCFYCFSGCWFDNFYFFRLCEVCVVILDQITNPEAVCLISFQSLF